ncbi:MAG: hypothetical protein ACKOCX_00705 [Planctomycetota bacterium]
MPAPAPSAALVEPLGRLLARVRREARVWIWVESLALLAVAAAAIFWGSLLLDWLIEPPAWVRGAAGAGAAVVLLWLLATRLIARLATPLSDRALALAIERRQPDCGDTLSTAVTLAEATAEPVDGDLADRTLSAAAALARRVSPAAVFRRGRLLGLAAVGMLAASSVAALGAARPAVASLWARRMVLLEDAPWPRRVRLEAEGFRDGVRTVARGSDVDLLVRATAVGPVPEIVELRSRSGAGEWQTVRMGTRGSEAADGLTFGHLLTAVGDNVELEIRGGDARLRGLVLDVVDPPALAAATVECTLPDYLGGGRRAPPASRVIPVPRGSRVEVTLTATKPLAAGTLTGRFADEPAVAADEPAEAADAGDGRVVASFTAAGPSGAALTAEIPSLDADCTLAANFNDTEGITNREPITLVLTAVPDEPPRLALRLAGISTAVTPAARLPIVGTLTDDHGLADASVSLAKGGDPLVVPLATIRGSASLVELPADQPAVIPLAPLGAVVGERVSVVVMARDGCTLAGGPNVGSSETWTLDVVSRESLQAMLEAREVLLRRRFEAAIDDLAQARRGLDAPADDAAAAAGRLAEATARAVGETGEIAAAFRDIRAELANNDLLTAALETRLVTEIADPLAAAATGPLASLAAACRVAAADTATAGDLPPRADAALAALRAVLARMLELESFNDVVDKLRGVLDAQERLRRDTLERQRKQARELLE